MRAEFINLRDEIIQSLELLRRSLDYDKALLRLDELNSLIEDPNFWNDASKAKELMQERRRLETGLQAIDELQTGLQDNLELIELGEQEGDEDIVEEAAQALSALKKVAADAEFNALLSGEADYLNCFLEIHSGAGGTEAQDWVAMLFRMYIRFAEQHGYNVVIMEESAGEEAGLKSATIKISGENAYGWLKTESGVHRLVRISPFDSSARRHTSFCSVGVYPEIDDNIEVDIKEEDVRTDTYRASGAGGQHVNKTESAVRLTHTPTGVVVQCQNDRSQHKNRAAAWSMLRARLYELELQKREEEAAEQHTQKTDIGWGHQIRSYVLHPYQMVKDLRTNIETSDTGGVLDGKLDEFIQAALSQRVHTD
ncbi:MAG: peptide chain release factor 2 [Alphaproteobacteria bacterium]